MEDTYINMNARPRVAVAGIYHETNTFAPQQTVLADFEQEWIVGAEAFIERYTGTFTSMGGVLDAAEDEELELVPAFYTYATPSGMIEAETADQLLRFVLHAIEDELKQGLDGILLILHGAMVAEGKPDMEGHLLKMLREMVGEALPIAVTIDLHANMSADMAKHASFIVGYDTYPHIDAYERAIDAVALLSGAIRHSIRPVMSWLQAGMIVVPQRMMTAEQPMRQLMEMAEKLEQDDRVLKVSIVGGFPYSDVPEAGMSFIVVTNNDLPFAKKCLLSLQRLSWSIREQFQLVQQSAAEAIQSALAIPQGPVVLAEGSDNVGGGAPADGTHLLPHLLAVKARSLIVIRDQAEAAAAHAKQAGDSYSGWIGGKSDKLHGEPVWIEGTIIRTSSGKYQHAGPYMAGQWANMGRTAVVETEYVTVILTEERVPPWDIEHVASLGINPQEYHIIVAKSAIAWQTAFGQIATASIHVNTPGCCSADLGHFDYHNLQRPVYPLDS